MILAGLGWQEVRDASQALATIRPGIFIGQRETDQRHRHIGETGRDTVDEAALGLVLSQFAIFKRRFLQKAREPYLLHTDHGNELGVSQIPTLRRKCSKVSGQNG